MIETGFRKKEGLTFKRPDQPVTVPIFLSILGGIMQTLSWPWPGLWPLCFISLIPLIMAADGQSGRRAFGFGWLYGLTLSLSSLPWLADVLAGYGGLGNILGWLILGLLAAFLALFPAFFAWISTMRLPGPLSWCLVGSIAWCGLDWIKNWIFTGFNWTPLAGPLVLSPELGQTADLVGFYGLGFFVALINFFLAVFVIKNRDGERGPATSYLACAIALIIAGFAYGYHQYGRWEKIAADSPSKIIAVIQPSTDQVQKWDEIYRDRLLSRFDGLARKADSHQPWLVLWPETALPFIYEYDFHETKWLQDLMRELGGQALVGVAGASGVWPQAGLHNRVMFFQNGQPVSYYDKMHLVPFGEYLPLDWLPFLKWTFMQGLIGAAGTYSPGQARPPIEALMDPQNPQSKKVRLGILICFESTFPYIGRQRVLEGAELLIVPTNDGWFGRSRAPEQHLHQAAMRAIETRRPLARVGNTGISAAIHPSGEIVWESQLFDVGAFPIKVPLLKPANLTTTFFVSHGYLLAPAMAVLSGLLIIIRFFRKQK